jgi:DNA polymerase-3 subunit epsilon
MREIVLDTETTGLDAKGGDRLIEVGCVELLNRIPSGREFHAYINPEDRAVHPDAEAVHGISNEFLKDKPRFADVAGPLMEFLGEDTPIVIHNAGFDIGFLNAELQRISQPLVAMHRVVDTLALARRKHPAAPNNLDALCKRYGIDNSKRTKHGALMDSFLLASVYVELLGEKQATLVLAAAGSAQHAGAGRRGAAAQRPAPLPSRISEEILRAHRLFIDTLGPKAIWKRFAGA